MRWSLVLLVLAATFLMLSPSIGSASIQSIHILSTTTLTSTADFDTGTKSQPGSPDGNYQIETVTDNPTIASGSFELASVKGDAFAFSDSDSATFKWATYADSSNAACGTTSSVIASGGYLIQVVGSGGSCRKGIHGTATITGNWDSQVKIVEVSATHHAEFALFNSITDNANLCSSTTDGVLMIRDTNDLYAYRCVNGSLAQVGSTATFTATTLWLRFARSGDTFWYNYSTDGSGWTNAASTTNSAIVNPVYPFMTTDAGSGSTVNDTYDDYKVNGGTIGAGGFRASGNWKSAGQSSTTELFQSVALTYSGASVSNYITAVSLISGTGTYRYVNNTDLTSGTSTTEIVPFVTISGAWKVQVNLTGSGTATINVQQIVIVHSTNQVPAFTNPITADSVEYFTPYSRDFNAVDPEGQSFTWAIVTNASGLSINANGTVSGTLQVIGTFYVNVTATDTSSGVGFDNYTLTSHVPPPPVQQIIGQATLVVAALLILMGFLIVITAILILLYGIRDRFLDPKQYKMGKR